MRYSELKAKHQKEINEFPMFFAFNEEQFSRGMTKLGLKPDETDKIYALRFVSGFYLRTDAPELREMLSRHMREFSALIDADKTGEGFIREMFDYELSNHEYIVTNNIADTLNALGLTAQQINGSTPLQNGLRQAIENQRLPV